MKLFLANGYFIDVYNFYFIRNMNIHKPMKWQLILSGIIQFEQFVKPDKTV